MSKKKETIDYKQLQIAMDSMNKALTIMHTVNLEELSKLEGKYVYSNSENTYKEICSNFKYVYQILEDKESLIAFALLRNAFEEMLYYMAAYLKRDLKITFDTQAGEIRNIVNENCIDIFNDYRKEDINNMYTHLSKLTHITSIKETTKFLNSKQDFKKYIVIEAKCQLIMMESMFMEFMHYTGAYENDVYIESAIICGIISTFNLICYAVVFKGKSYKELEIFLIDEKTKKYLRKTSSNVVNNLSAIEKESSKLIDKFNALGKEYDNKVKELGYKFDI